MTVKKERSNSLSREDVGVGEVSIRSRTVQQRDESSKSSLNSKTPTTFSYVPPPSSTPATFGGKTPCDVSPQHLSPSKTKVLRAPPGGVGPSRRQQQSQKQQELPPQTMLPSMAEVISGGSNIAVPAPINLGKASTASGPLNNMPLELQVSASSAIAPVGSLVHMTGHNHQPKNKKVAVFSGGEPGNINKMSSTTSASPSGPSSGGALLPEGVSIDYYGDRSGSSPLHAPDTSAYPRRSSAMTGGGDGGGDQSPLGTHSTGFVSTQHQKRSKSSLGFSHSTSATHTTTGSSKQGGSATLGSAPRKLAIS